MCKKIILILICICACVLNNVVTCDFFLYPPLIVSVTFLLLSGNTGGVFGIDNTTGLIFIAKELDLTSLGFYTLSVRVTDSGFPPLMATASVRISLILSDFSKPKFSQKEYQAEVKKIKNKK